tara:strand:- start:5364 stop:5642 length:279 start_codon:yes stop_codon:yes gene_type:complete
MNNIIEKEVIWAKGRKKSEQSKYTAWSSSKDYGYLGGLSLTAYDFPSYITFHAHSSDGKTSRKYFQIPVDKIDDLCHALQEVKHFCINQNKK